MSHFLGWLCARLSVCYCFTLPLSHQSQHYLVPCRSLGDSPWGAFGFKRLKICESLEMVPGVPGEHCGLGKDGNIFYYPSKLHTDIWPTLPCILITHWLDWKLTSYMLSYIFWVQFSDPQTNSLLWLSLNDEWRRKFKSNVLFYWSNWWLPVSNLFFFLRI